MADLSKSATRFLAQRAPKAIPEIHVDLRDLIVHKSAVRADDTLETVQHRFADSDVSYMAVVEDGKVIGLCARTEIAMQLGSQYGFALFGRSPVRAHRVPGALIVSVHSDWQDVLQQVFSRVDDRFNDDVVLADDAGELLGLITVQNLIRLQTRLLLQAIDHLKQQRAEIERSHRHMMAELMMAREVQRAMQPRDFDAICAKVATEQHGVKIVAHYEPTGVVSGDFFEVLPVADSTLSIIVADVMGHGVQAALVTAMLRALLQEHSGLAQDPAALLTAVNNSLCSILTDIADPVFVSAFAAALHTPTTTLSFANAGHPCPVIFQSSKGKAQMLECADHLNGGVLGISHGSTFQKAKTVMKPGDKVLIYTDGLFEVTNPDDEILGQEGLLAIAAPYMDKPAESLLRQVLDATLTFSRQTHFNDDVCVLVMELV